MEQSTQPATVQPAPARVTRAGSTRAGTLLLVVAALVAVGGVAFAVGRLTAPAAAAVNRPGAAAGVFGNRPNASGAPGLGGGIRQGALGGGTGITVRGTVRSISSSMLVLTLENGQNVEIPLDTSTTYHRETTGSASDVQPGKTVQVRLSGRREENTPGASPAPNASGEPSLGPAREVTVVSP